MPAVASDENLGNTDCHLFSRSTGRTHPRQLGTVLEKHWKKVTHSRHFRCYAAGEINQYASLVWKATWRNVTVGLVEL